MIDQRFKAPAANLLAGRVIAITGAGDGIGRAVAMDAAAHGAQVILIGRTSRKLEAVRSDIVALHGERALIAVLDLEKALAADYDQLADAIASQYGRLDGLVHCAGILGTLTPIEQYDVPTWCKVMHVNVTAAFVLTQVLLPLLRQSPSASVLFTSSGVGRTGRAYWGAYSVSKFAIEGLSQVLAAETSGNTNVRVNVVNPGAVRTLMRRQAFPSEKLESLTLPAAVTPTFLWLLGPDSLGITGESLDAQ
ncbi:MAG: YciK family oxidoreductase [Proteobacteria bacterium]|nr:YciK family oxidoreductase [Pseudomonadota bacterium]